MCRYRIGIMVKCLTRTFINIWQKSIEVDSFVVFKWPCGYNPNGKCRIDTLLEWNAQVPYLTFLMTHALCESVGHMSVDRYAYNSIADIMMPFSNIGSYWLNLLNFQWYRSYQCRQFRFWYILLQEDHIVPSGRYLLRSIGQSYEISQHLLLDEFWHTANEVILAKARCKYLLQIYYKLNLPLPVRQVTKLLECTKTHDIAPVRQNTPCAHFMVSIILTQSKNNNLIEFFTE